MHSVTRIIWRAIAGTIGAALLFGTARAANATADVCDQVDTLSKLEICRTEVQKHPMNVELQQKLGDAMVYLGDYDAAAEAYREITKVRQHGRRGAPAIGRYTCLRAALRRSRGSHRGCHAARSG